MKKLLLILLCLPMIGFGQSWETTFGGTNDDWGASVQQTTDGGYIIAGITSSFGNGDEDVLLTKTDGNGIELWTKTFGGTNSDGAHSVQQTTDGGFIITGATESFGLGNGTGDVYLIKTDENGDSLWTRTFGGTNADEGYSVQQTTDGGYVIIGSTYVTVDQGDVYLLKTDGNGNLLWSRTFGGIEEDEGHSIQQTTDGGYIITGMTRLPPIFDDDVYLIKTDANGIEQWSKSFGGAANEESEGASVQQTTDGGYIIAGKKPRSEIEDDDDVYLIKTDANGVEQWSKVFGGTDDDWGNSVQQTTDGGYVIIGGTESFGAGERDVYLIKTDGNGDSLWTRTFGGIEEDEGHSIQQTTDGGYIISGDNQSFGNGGEDIYLIKTYGNDCSTTSTDTHIACDEFMWYCDGNTYTSSNNTATYIYTNTAGCDSTVTLDLTINNSTSNSTTQTACDTYTWSVDSNTYASSGTYTNVSTNAAGCDHTETLELTINSVIASISQSGETLSSVTTPVGLTANWYNIQTEDGDSRIWLMEEESSAFMPRFDCSYFIVVSNNGCIDTSETYYYGANAARIGSIITSPNPTSGLINVKFENSKNQFVMFELISNNGSKLDEFITVEDNLNIDLSKYPSGSYYLYFNSEDRVQGCILEEVQKVSTKIILNK
jgi:regulation of enolase protein 1 (concanavalin A-like superfamily)